MYVYKGAAMKKAFCIAILILVFLFLFTGCAQDLNVDLLKGGDFEYEDTAELRNDWNLVAQGTSENVFSVSNGALGINTTSAGWAYAAQELQLKSNSYYKISYTFNIASITYYGDATSFNGLFIGFLEDRNFNIGESSDGVIKPILHNGATNVDVTTDIYLKTDYITKATLAIFVGTEDAPVSANVTIKDIAFERVKKSAVPVNEDPDTGKDVIVAFKLDTKVYGANSSKNILFIVLGGVFTVLAGYALYIVYKRNLHLETTFKDNFLAKLRDSKYLPLIAVIAFAALIRLLIAGIATILAANATTAYLGYNVEAAAAQAKFIAEFGTVYFKSTLETYTAKYNYAYAAYQTAPLMYYVLGLAGLLSRIFNGGIALTSFFIKLFAIAADIGIIVIIYKLLENRTGRLSAVIMSSLYGILPIVFSVSAGWGMSESVTVFLITLTLYFALKNNFWGVSGAYLAAFLFSPNAIFMLPIVIFYMVSQFISRPKLRLPILLSLVVGFGVCYALTAPFNLLDIQAGKPFAAVTDYYNSVFVANKVYTANAFNFQAMLKNNFEVITTESVFITILFIVFIIALVAAGYFKNRNRLELVLLSALLMTMLYTFTNRMTPVSMYMALPLMFIYAAMQKEKRVYFTFIAYAALMFINASYVYMVAGYSASGIEQLTYDNAMMYVFGAFSVLLNIYFIYVVYDIVVTRKAAVIKPMEKTYIAAVKMTGLRIKKFFYKIKAKFSK